jgi:hypothetical protein
MFIGGMNMLSGMLCFIIAIVGIVVVLTNLWWAKKCFGGWPCYTVSENLAKAKEQQRWACHLLTNVMIEKCGKTQM